MQTGSPGTTNGLIIHSKTTACAEKVKKRFWLKERERMDIFWKLSIFYSRKSDIKEGRKRTGYTVKYSFNFRIYFSVVWQVLAIGSFKYPRVAAKEIPLRDPDEGNY